MENRTDEATRPPQDNATSGRAGNRTDADPLTRPVEVVEGTPDEEPTDGKPHLNE